MKQSVIKVINGDSVFYVPINYRPSGGSQQEKILSYASDNNITLVDCPKFGMIEIEQKENKE